MPTLFLYTVVLHCLEKMNGERTVYAIYHLLSGKKSSQTIQDAHLFHLTQFFKSYSHLTRDQFDEMIQTLENLALIVKKAEHEYILSESGKQHIVQQWREYPFIRQLNGWKFQQSDLFWQRLSLLVQVASHLRHNQAGYMPIQRNRAVQEYVKGILRTLKLSRKELSSSLYKEMTSCLETIAEIDPAVMVIRLTGEERIGYTEKQAYDALQIEASLYHYQFLASLHSLMEKVVNNQTSFPLLYALMKDFQTGQPLTESTKRTYTLLKQGYTITEISKIRNLKVSTIQDHVVELSVQLEQFDILPYVDERKLKLILEAKDKSASKQLRQIRDIVPEADYFEIRLVLTKYGDE